MNDLPRTPRTLPCDDEDYIFAFHEDGNASNNSVGVEIGTTTSPEDCFLPMFDHANNAQKILNFDEALTKRTETEHILHTHDGETHTRQRMKQKRNHSYHEARRDNEDNKRLYQHLKGRVHTASLGERPW